MGFFDRFRRTADAKVALRRSTPDDDAGLTVGSTEAPTEVPARPDDLAHEQALELDRLALEMAAETERLAATMGPEIERLAATMAPEIERMAATIEAEAHVALEAAAEAAAEPSAEAEGDEDDPPKHADTLRRSEYVSREHERGAFTLGADGLPHCRLTMVRDQLVLSSPAGLINPKSPHAYKVGIYSFSVRGTSHYERAERQGDLSPGRQLRLVREPSNKFDPNAVAVHALGGRTPVGYVNKQNAKRLAPLMDAGTDVVAVSLRGTAPGVTGLVPYVLAAERQLMEHLLRDAGITLE